MDKAAFDDYVENRYQKQMEYYSKSSSKNQKKYKQFQWILIVLSAATPVLAALSGKSIKFNGVLYSLDLQILVIVVSAIVAILTTGLKTFGYQELWANYRSTYEKLKHEIYYYNFSVGPYSEKGINRESLFVTRVETILDAEHNQWPPAKKLQENPNKPEDKESSTSAPTNTESDDNSNGVAPSGIPTSQMEATKSQ